MAPPSENWNKEYLSAIRPTNGSLGDTMNSEHEEYLGPETSRGDAIKRIKSAGTVSLSPELFEKLYLQPPTSVSSSGPKNLANPTPIGLLGYLLALSPLACTLMGWRNSAANDLYGTGVYLFCGGLLMLLGGIGEWILGNTFPAVVFISFGGFWFSFGTTLTPLYHAYATYATTDDPTSGLHSPKFESSWGFFMLAMAFMCLIYLVCALRTNIVFVTIFFGLMMLFLMLAGAYWQDANGNHALSDGLKIASGVFGLVAVAAGWYIFISIMLAALDFPFALPVGDLSHLIKGASEKSKV